MPSVTYEYIPGQQVYVIEDSTVKSGTVSLVDIEIDTDGTSITYWILLDDENTATPFDESNVFENCRAAPGYQDAVYLNDLTGTPSPVAIDAGSPVTLSGSPLPMSGSPPVVTLTADIIIDGGAPITISHVVVGGETFADLVAEIDTQLGAAATASLYQNNIRITSASTGTTSTVQIGTGSPISEDYFRFLNNFTGLAASVDGLDEGAVETLADTICPR